tara:strand:+ start:309 stop:689 length:381 start_codon:yes stop_codon:yes gene_type:complete
MVTENPDKIAALEKAIAKKYGDDAVQNPQAQWDEIKEEEYLEQMKQLYAKIKVNESFEEKIDINGIKVSKKLFNRESLRSCSVCGSFPKKSIDDVCLTKFECCNKCYVKYVEDREERWLKGWRPNN